MNSIPGPNRREGITLEAFLQQLALLVSLLGITPRKVVDLPNLFLAVGGGGKLELRVGNKAPWGRPNSKDPIETIVLAELIQRGRGTPAELIARLEKNKQFLSPAQVESALASWIEKGWVTFSGDQAHVTRALIEYLK